MSKTNNLISLRIPDDELALMDHKIGTEGLRNRSDVIRRAVREYLGNEPMLPGIKKVSVELGTAHQYQLAHLKQLTSITTEQALLSALTEFIERKEKQISELNHKLEKTTAEMLDRTSPSEEFQQ